MNKNISFWQNGTLPLLLARFYNTPRLNDDSTAVAWDMFNQNTKKPLYPTSKEILEILKVKEWADVKAIGKNVLKYWQKELNKMDVRKELQARIRQLEYLEVLNPHKVHLSTITQYKKYREQVSEQYQLPSVNSIILTFGSWKEFKWIFDSEKVKKGRKEVYTDEQLKAILDIYTQQFDFNDWDKYSQKYNLPSKKTFIHRLTKKELEPYLKNGYHRAFDDLITIAWDYRKEFATLSIRKWDIFANEHKIPSKRTFMNHWGKTLYARVMKVLEDPNCTYRKYKDVFQ